MNYKATALYEYWRMIEKGEIIVGYWIRQEIENLIYDLESQDYIYDTREAEKRFAFQEKMCLQSKQPYYGKPIKLMPWQRAFWEPLYSFRMADTQLRRFNKALIEIARKNGKSTMFAADGTTDLFIGRGGADIVCASNDDRQAKLIWEEIAGMRARLDPHRFVSRQNLTEIKNTIKDITIKRLSSKTQNKDGFNICKLYLDESHDMKDNEIAEAGWRGMSSQDEPLFLNCTTQGFIYDGYLDNEIMLCKKVIKGEIENIHILPFLYEQDSEAEVWQNESSWEKSNPSIRYGVKKTAKIRNDIETAKFDKASRIHLLCKDFNIKQNTAESWLNLEDYNYPATYDLNEFNGAVCLGAADLSETTDMTALKILLMRPGDKTKYIHSHYFIPEGKLERADDKLAGAKYAEWAQEGLLTITEGNDIDLSICADWFYRLYSDYNIKLWRCGYDQRFAKDFIAQMNRYGWIKENDDLIMILQNGYTLTNAMKLCEADFKHRLINYNGNSIDKWCFGNAAIKVDNEGHCLPVKKEPHRRIDGTAALVILYEMYRRYRSDYRLIIEEGEKTNGLD